MSRRFTAAPSRTTTMTTPQIQVRSPNGNKPCVIPLDKDDTLATFTRKVLDKLGLEGDYHIVFPLGSPKMDPDAKLLDIFPRGATVNLVRDGVKIVRDGKTNGQTELTQIYDNRSAEHADQKNLRVTVGHHEPQGLEVKINGNQAGGTSTQHNAVVSLLEAGDVGLLFK